MNKSMIWLLLSTTLFGCFQPPCVDVYRPEQFIFGTKTDWQSIQKELELLNIGITKHPEESNHRLHYYDFSDPIKQRNGSITITQDNRIMEVWIKFPSVQIQQNFMDKLKKTHAITSKKIKQAPFKWQKNWVGICNTTIKIYNDSIHIIYDDEYRHWKMSHY